MAPTRNPQEVDPETLIQIGMMTKFSGIGMLPVLLFFAYLHYPSIASYAIAAIAVLNIPFSYIIAERFMIARGKEMLKAEHRESAGSNDIDEETPGEM